MDSNLEEWILEADIVRMQTAMESGSVSSEDLVTVYLERVR